MRLAGHEVFARVQRGLGGAGAGQVEAGRARGHAAADRRPALAAHPAPIMYIHIHPSHGMLWGPQSGHDSHAGSVKYVL